MWCDFLLQPIKDFFGSIMNWVSAPRVSDDLPFDLEFAMTLANHLTPQQFLVLKIAIYIKVADLIYRMEIKGPSVPINARKRSRHVEKHIIIYGNNLVSWFIANMDIKPEEALFLANLLCSHRNLFDLTSEVMIQLKFGTFYRSQYGTINELSDEINDYEYAAYLCNRELILQSRGDVDNYKIDRSQAYKIDFSRWKFDFIQAS